MIKADTRDRRTPEGNTAIAEALREYADILEQQGEDGFRIRAYRRAGETVATLALPIEGLIEQRGTEGLTNLPGIGRSIAAAILEMTRTGRWSQLDRLRGLAEPEQLFQTIPGIGPELAERIHDELHVDTLEALEVAAHDGRLDSVPGLGRRRVAIIRSILAERLGRRRQRRAPSSPAPPVSLVLDVDAEYRDKASQGVLRLIAPKRFNPAGEAWLPILHVRRGEWDFTLLFSNTRRAHELGMTRDWVVVYHHAGTKPEGQCTVVTETRGALAGERVVRGREDECRRYYDA